MKAYFYLGKCRMNNKGTAPIVCRVAESFDNRRDFRTGIYIDPELWDKQRGLPKTNDNQVCTRLQNILNKVYAFIAECEREEINSPFDVIARYRGAKQIDRSNIREIAYEYYEAAKPAQITVTRIKVAVDLFCKFNKNMSIKLVIPETIKGFERYLQETEKAAYSTVQKKIQHLKAVFAFAKHRNYIKSNLFDIYRMAPAPKLELIQLSPIELKRLERYTFSSDRLEKVKDMFLFQCYTGLAYSDLQCFASDNIIDSNDCLYIKGARNKTGEEYFLPFLPEAQAIAEKYNYELPVLSNQKFNSYLKEIGDILAIKAKKLFTHVGRKTFGQIMIDKGYSAEAVAKMMGHTDFKMTQKHYARVGEVRVENESVRISAQEANTVSNFYKANTTLVGIA